jgi:hypothetical protein
MEEKPELKRLFDYLQANHQLKSTPEQLEQDRLTTEEIAELHSLVREFHPSNPGR